MLRSFFLLLVLAGLFAACNTVKYTADNMPEKQLSFGSGGGLSGEVVEYVMLENGQIFKRQNLIRVTGEMKSISKSKAKKMFDKWYELKIDTMEMIRPYNIYYFIQMEVDRKNSHRIVWGKPDFAPPAAVQSYFGELSALPKPLKKAPEPAKQPGEKVELPSETVNPGDQTPVDE